MASRVNSYSRRIALIGGSQSGKTTYLAATDLFCLRDIRAEYSFEGIDDASKSFLRGIRNGLAENKFPGGTIAEQHLGFMLKKSNEPLVHIDVVDANGASYLDLQDDSLADHVAHSHGIILLVNHAKPNNLQLLETVIERIKSRIDESNFPLPHRISICISQYDSPSLFDELKKSGYVTDHILRHNNKSIHYPWITPYPELEKWPFPTEGKTETEQSRTARDIIENYVTGGKDINRRLRDNFYSDRIRYMAISSVGFHYRDEENGELKVDYHDYSNIVCIDGADQIRDFENMMPVNLLMPIIWASADNNI